MPRKYSTSKLALKAFKEVYASAPLESVLYPIAQNLKSLLDVYQIFVMGKLLDSIAQLITSSTVFTIENFVTTEAFYNIFLLIVISFFATLFSKLSDYFNVALQDTSWRYFQERSIQKMSQLNLEDVEDHDFQNLLAKAPAYGWNSVWATYKILINLGYYFVLFLSSAFIIATQMSWVGLLVIFFVIPEAFLRYYYNIKMKKYRDYDTEKMKYFEYLFAQSTLIRNFAELRVDNSFKFFLKSFRSSATQYYEKLNKIRFTRMIFRFLTSWLDGSLTKIVQVLLIPISISRGFTIGTFKYLFDYIERLYNSSWNLLWNTLDLRINGLYVQDYLNFFEYEGFGDVATGSEKLDPLKVPRIELVNIDFSYPDSPSAALQDVSFTVGPGEKVAIIGRDNSGKSTIAKLICGLYRIGPGDILIDDISVKNLSRGELKNKIAVVFENFIKYNFSIRKNITVTQPERDFSRRLYEEALEITGLDEWLNEEEIDDHMALGKLFGKGIDVSTGHWQRIAIARAIYHDRVVLILDESLTQIDSFSRRPILEKLIKHRPNQTLIHITQEVENQDLFDTIVQIEKGKISKIEQKKKK